MMAQPLSEKVKDYYECRVAGRDGSTWVAVRSSVAIMVRYDGCQCGGRERWSKSYEKEVLGFQLDHLAKKN